MIYLNCGNLWSYQYLREVIELNKQHEDDGIRVSSLFGSLTRVTPTARSTDRLPEFDMGEAQEYIKFAKSNDIAIRYTLNASCLGSIQSFKKSWDGNLMESIMDLHDMGVDEWTVTSPLLINELCNMFPNDLIEVSTIAEAFTPNDIHNFMEHGANAFNLSTSINREFRLLKRIVEMRVNVSLLANEACLYRCPMRRDCYNLSTHDSDRSNKYFGYYPFRWCNEIRLNDPVEWIKSRMILPQWMKIYEQELGINKFKIAYRTHPMEVALPILKLYMDQYHGGNYLDLWPTIRSLGKTEEPKDYQYISCERLDERGFIEEFVKGKSCINLRCGVDCTHCQEALEHSFTSPEKIDERSL